MSLFPRGTERWKTAASTSVRFRRGSESEGGGGEEGCATRGEKRKKKKRRKKKRKKARHGKSDKEEPMDGDRGRVKESEGTRKRAWKKEWKERERRNDDERETRERIYAAGRRGASVVRHEKMVIPSRMCPMHMHIFPQNGWSEGGGVEGGGGGKWGREGEERRGSRRKYRRGKQRWQG